MNRVSRILSLVVAGVLALSLVGCSQDFAAKVNGQVIKKAEIDTQLEQLKKQYPDMFGGKDGKDRAAEFYDRLLDQEVNKVLVMQAAKEKGVTVSEKAVDKQIAELKKGFPNDAAFQDALKKNNMTLEKLKDQVRVQLQSEALVKKLTANTKVSDAELKKYYDDNKAQLFTEKAGAHAAHILFEEKDKAKAEQVLAEIKKDPGKFAELAKKNSKDPGSAANGGDLGWPTSPYVPEFQKTLDSLKPGEMAPSLVKTQFGYHIIKVIEKRKDAVQPFDKVKDQVKAVVLQQKQAEAFQKLLDDLKKKAKIEYPEKSKDAKAKK